jgi:hypothetical protein
MEMKEDKSRSDESDDNGAGGMGCNQPSFHNSLPALFH